MKEITATELKELIYKKANNGLLYLRFSNLIVTGTFHSLLYDRFKKESRPNSISFKNCVFKDNFFMRSFYSHKSEFGYITLRAEDCFFEKGLEFGSTVQNLNQFFIKNTKITGKLKICGTSYIKLVDLTAEIIHLERSSYDQKGKIVLSIGRISASGIISTDLTKEAGVKILSCHIATIPIITKLFPNAPIEYIYTNKGEKIIDF